MKVLLVDDDVEMLESMRRMTVALGENWCVAGLAEDGVEALEILQNQPVDILVTDITMMEMDGLELIARARALHPSLHSLLITCHEDFQYAQEGIQLGVDDYLLKYTLTPARFQKALQRSREKLEAVRHQEDSLQHLSTEVYKNREHFRENLIRMVLSAPAADIQPLLDKAPLYGIALPQRNFTVTEVFPAARLAQHSADEALVGYAVMNVAQELMDFAASFTFRLEGRIYLLLWGVDADPAWRARLAERLTRLQEHFEKKFNIALCAVAGVRQTQFSGLRQMLDTLAPLREQCFYGTGIVLQETANRSAFAAEPIPGRYLNAIQDALFDPQRLRDTFAQVIAALRQNRYAPAQVRAFLDNCVTHLQVLARCCGSPLPYTPITGATFAACCAQVQALLDSLRGACFWKPGKRPGADVQQVAEYVNAHLDTEISLESAAALVHKNSSYFSRQFKKETGLSFSEFVIRQRVQRATYLLQHTDLSVERIAEKVGIANSQYFSTFYKRETGRSPGEVRRQKGEPVR